MIHVGFTGTQSGMSDRQLKAASVIVGTLSMRPWVLHHGDCIGADADMHSMAVGHAKTVIHPPSNPAKRAYCEADEVLPALPYLKRNRAIVDACDILVATPKSLQEEVRSGTWATVRYARKLKVPVILLDP